MVARGWVAWLAFTNSNPSTGSTWSPWRTGRGFSEDLAFLPQDAMLPAQAPQLLAFLLGHPVGPLALIPVGLDDPVTEGGGRRFELSRELLGRPPRAHELDHPASKLRWIRGTCSGHLWTPPPPQGNSVHQTGSTPVGGLWRLRGRSAGRAPLRPAPARRLSLGRQTDGSDLDLSAYVTVAIPSASIREWSPPVLGPFNRSTGCAVQRRASRPSKSALFGPLTTAVYWARP